MTNPARAWLLLSALPAAAVASTGLPSMEEARTRAAGLEAPAITAVQEVSPPLPAGGSCAGLSLGQEASVEARMFTWNVVYDVQAAGRPLARVVSRAGGYDIVDPMGALLATARPGKERGLAAVSDCAGRPIGAILESDSGWRGERSFTLRDGRGAAVANTPVVGFLSRRFSVSDGMGPAASFESAHWFFDRWRVTVPRPGAVDDRLLLLALAYNNAADSRESARRRREHGRHRGHRHPR